MITSEDEDKGRTSGQQVVHVLKNMQFGWREEKWFGNCIEKQGGCLKWWWGARTGLAPAEVWVREQPLLQKQQ